MKIKVWKNIIPDGELLFRKYWEEMGDARSLVKMRKWCIAEDTFTRTERLQPRWRSGSRCGAGL